MLAGHSREGVALSPRIPEAPDPVVLIVIAGLLAAALVAQVLIARRNRK
jgi:hypothetical protein